MDNQKPIQRLLNFLFYTEKDSDTIPVLSRIRLSIIYIISLTAAFLAVPYGIFLLPTEDILIKSVFFAVSAIFISSSIIFIITRNLSIAQLLTASGIIILGVEEIIDITTYPGLGPLVLFSIIPVFYLIFEFRISILLPVLLSACTIIRIFTADFSEKSLYFNPEFRFSFAGIILIAGILSTATIFGIRYVVKYLINLAFTDQITKIPNRNRLQQLLKKKCFKNRSPGSHYSLIGIEILNFNNLNSNIGTENCDKVLKEAAQRITLFSSDITGRWSGSIFIISTDIYNLKAVNEFCKTVLNVLSEAYLINSRLVYVNFVLAVSRYPDDGRDPDVITSNLISLLDRKSRSAGDILFHDEETIKREQYIYTITEALNSAVFDMEFSLEYQPKISIDDGKYRSAEALIRWDNPELGKIPPCDFIPAAEECGMIRKLTLWVIKKTFTDRMKFTLNNSIIFAVNLSIQDLKDFSFIHNVSEILESTGCSPSFIEFEITERFQLDNDPQLISNIRNLYEMGFRIAIDDFGTGYSNLSYLQKLEINNLKIDKTFIDEISEAADRTNYPIIDTIISLGNSLGAEITAEGVENDFQLNYLKDKHCSTVQGWLFAKSMTIDDLQSFLKNNLK